MPFRNGGNGARDTAFQMSCENEDAAKTTRKRNKSEGASDKAHGKRPKANPDETETEDDEPTNKSNMASQGYAQRFTKMIADVNKYSTDSRHVIYIVLCTGIWLSLHHGTVHSKHWFDLLVISNLLDFIPVQGAKDITRSGRMREEGTEKFPQTVKAQALHGSARDSVQKSVCAKIYNDRETTMPKLMKDFRAFDHHNQESVSFPELTYELLTEIFNPSRHETSVPKLNNINIGLSELFHVATRLGELGTTYALNPRKRRPKADGWFADLADMWVKGRLNDVVSSILNKNLPLVGNENFELPVMTTELREYWFPQV